MIEIKGLVKRIGDKVILRGVNLNIMQGQTVGILGSNGAGKSTLLKVIATLVKPTSGEIKVGNMDLKKQPLEIKKEIGFLPHASMLYDHFTPYENLQFYGKVYGVSNLDTKIPELISKVGLKLFTHEPVKSFSRGMVQRIAIARAIIHDPSILLLDEPHTGLDQQAIEILNTVMGDLRKRNVTTIMVTHDFIQAAQTCDRIVIIKQGKVADDFMLENQSFEQLYARYKKVVEGDKNA